MYRKLDFGDWLLWMHRNGSLFVCSSARIQMKYSLSLQHLLVTPKVQEAWGPCRGRQGDPGPSVNQKSFETGRAIYRVWYIVIPGITQRIFLIWQASDLRSLRIMVNNICCFCCTRLQDLFEQQRTGKMTSPTRGGKMAPWRWKPGNHGTSAFHVMTWCVELEENPRSEHKGAFCPQLLGKWGGVWCWRIGSLLVQIHPETKYPLDKYQKHGKLDVHVLYNVYIYTHNILSLN